MMMKDRWIALYVENQVGVLAKISGLFAGKSYNMKSLTVGTTENDDISRMTISSTCDDLTFEQIKKQLNRMVEVIKVMDLTETPIHMKELMFAKVKKCSEQDRRKPSGLPPCFRWKWRISARTAYCSSAS